MFKHVSLPPYDETVSSHRELAAAVQQAHEAQDTSEHLALNEHATRLAESIIADVITARMPG